ELSCYFDEEIKQIPVKAGTLLIANVFGMHSRGQSQINVSRRAIHGSIRFMPPYKKLSRQLLLVRHSISNAFHQL
ncbi:MAG: hypothetical protein VW124_22120, partial [Paracoccaceae bacterium]